MDWSNLQEDYERLGTQHAVAAEYGCVQQTVAKAMKRLGIPAKSMQEHAQYIWDDKDDLQGAYDRLGSIRAVAEAYDCGYNTIWRATQRLGLELPVTSTGRKFTWTEEHRANHKAATNAPEFKEAHRVSLLSRFDTLRSKATDSPLEKLLHAALNRVGVSYTTQQVKLGKYVTDIELLQAPIIIEADGFLHRLERKRAADRIRDQELVEAGYRVFRFTGTEINANADACIRLIMDTTGVTPDAHLIADIRRQGMGPDNMNWQGGKTQLVCLYCGQIFESYRKEARFCNRGCYTAYRNR